MNNSEVLVAIRCITYNHEPYIRDCLEGFIMQKTNFKFVAIVHDDASTDGTASIIKEYAEKYPDIIKPIFETENQYSKKDGSLGRIMDAAIEETGAKYVAMCEGDDYWIDPYKLQKQVDFMEANEEIGLCYTDYNVCDENGKLLEESHYEQGTDSPILSFEEHLFKQGYIAPMSWLYRLDVYKKIAKNKLKGATDGTYIVALEFFLNSKVSYLPLTTACYRISKGSASRPFTLEAVYKYRKGVYKIEYEYASMYYRESIVLSFIQSREIEELYPLARRINNVDYIEWCKSIEKVNPFVNLKQLDCEVTSYREQYERLQSSNAYRIGKFLLKPLSYFRRMLNNVNRGGVEVVVDNKSYRFFCCSNKIEPKQRLYKGDKNACFNYLVAIKCLAYNHEPYIRDCLEGFIMQKTNFKFVAIVHDDASTDGTAAIIKEYAEKYPEIIKPIFETENQYSKRDGSLGRIMSNAISETGAKYVAMCEGDDYWIDPYKLQKQVDFMEANPEYSICFHKVNTLINETGEMKDEFIVREMPNKSTIVDLAEGNYIHTPSVLYRTNKLVVEKYVRMMPCLPGDYVLWMLLAEIGDIYKFDEAMAVYRYGSGIWSTNQTIKNDLAYLCTLNKLYVIITNSLARKNIQKQIKAITESIIHIERGLNQIRSSKAYRLGKFLLRPFK